MPIYKISVFKERIRMKRQSTLGLLVVGFCMATACIGEPPAYSNQGEVDVGVDSEDVDSDEEPDADGEPDANGESDANEESDSGEPDAGDVDEAFCQITRPEDGFSMPVANHTNTGWDETMWSLEASIDNGSGVPVEDSEIVWKTGSEELGSGSHLHGVFLASGEHTISCSVSGGGEDTVSVHVESPVVHIFKPQDGSEHTVGKVTFIGEGYGDGVLDSDTELEWTLERLPISLDNAKIIGTGREIEVDFISEGSGDFKITLEVCEGGGSDCETTSIEIKVSPV